MQLEDKIHLVRLLKGYRDNMSEFSEEEMDYLISLVEDQIGPVEPLPPSDDPMTRTPEWKQKVKEVLAEELEAMKYIPSTPYILKLSKAERFDG